jgi:hypothetical protein
VEEHSVSLECVADVNEFEISKNFQTALFDIVNQVISTTSQDRIHFDVDSRSRTWDRAFCLASGPDKSMSGSKSKATMTRSAGVNIFGMLFPFVFE